MEERYYYKIVSFKTYEGQILSTQERVDFIRAKRYSRLINLFEQIYNCSKEYELPIGNVLFLINVGFLKRRKNRINNLELEKCINNIRNESSKQHFKISKEFRWFNDYILEKAKSELQNELGLILPNRFESGYFFESIEDCCKYYYNLPKKALAKIIQVEFTEQISLHKFDNKLITEFQDYYTSDDYYNQAKLFLIGGTSATPLFEIVFKGKYRVLAHFPLL